MTRKECLIEILNDGQKRTSTEITNKFYELYPNLIDEKKQYYITKNVIKSEKDVWNQLRAELISFMTQHDSTKSFKQIKEEGKTYYYFEDHNNVCVIKPENIFKEFWNKFLKEINTYTDLFNSRTTSNERWLSSKSIKNTHYGAVVIGKYVKIQLWFIGEKEENEKLFDYLFDNKNEIEKTFGNNLEWRKIENKKACEIKYQLNGVNIYDKTQWGKIINFFITNTENFRKSIDPFLFRYHNLKQKNEQIIKPDQPTTIIIPKEREIVYQLTCEELGWKCLTIYKDDDHLNFELSECPEYTYVFDDNTKLKIGRTSQENPVRRLDAMKTANPTIHIDIVFPSSQHPEKELHKRFDDSRMVDNREWFHKTKSLSKFIEEHKKKNSIALDWYYKQIKIKDIEKNIINW